MNILEMTKKAAIEMFKEKLRTDENWALKGLLTIYELQTHDEKNRGATVEHNGVGFTGFDSNILSSFAVQVKSGKQMSVRQMATIHKCMPKYAQQLYKIAYAKAEAQQMQEKPTEIPQPSVSALPVSQPKKSTSGFKLVAGK